MFKKTITAILAIAMIGLGTASLAQSCAPRDDVVKKLEESYSEQLAFGGLQKQRGSQAVMEVWANRETGSYTVLVTQPNGIACIVAVGTDFFEAIPKIKQDGDPT